MFKSATGEQLRRLWTNLKTRHRDSLTRERQHRLATGGGGPCPDAVIDANIAEIAPALLVEIPNALDSDTLEIYQTQPEVSTPLIYNPEQLSAPANTNIIGPSTSCLLPPTSPPQNDPQTTPMSPQTDFPPATHHAFNYSFNEKKLRVQILKREHLSREKRAEEVHSMRKKFEEEKHSLEVEILKENLREAKARAELAQRELC
ncbi:unnamed protein product [Arctia plantaginis]|uniref:Uncharacterized protein n=1 Tax=Arctia plantaginis TaxID=874455 RepID=A0A8S1A872_ARCPL|nr:unnamed protein product [Arctia plantaginis]